MAIISGKIHSKKISGISLPDSAQLGSVVISSDNDIFVSDFSSAATNQKTQVYHLQDNTNHLEVINFPEESANAVPQGLAIQEKNDSSPTLWLTDYQLPQTYWYDLNTNQNGKIELGEKASEGKSRGIAYGDFNAQPLVIFAQEGVHKPGHVFVVDASGKKVIDERTQSAPDIGGAPTNVLLYTEINRVFVGDYTSSRIYYFDPTKKADDNNKLIPLDLDTSLKTGCVYGMALAKGSKTLWVLDNTNVKLFPIISLDGKPAVDKARVIDLNKAFNTSDLQNLWDLVIDSEEYLWVPCSDKDGKGIILEINPEGHPIGAYPIAKDSEDDSSETADYPDTSAVGKLIKSQTHDVICVTNRNPAELYLIKPGVIAKDHSKGPNPDNRPIGDDVAFVVVPSPLKAEPNGNFAETKVTVKDSSGATVANTVVEVRIGKDDLKNIKITPSQDHPGSTPDFITLTTDANGVATIPPGMLKAGEKPSTGNITVTTRGAKPQLVPYEIAIAVTLNTEKDVEEWARRTTGQFNLTVSTKPVTDKVKITVELNDKDFAEGARFLDQEGHKIESKSTEILTTATGDASIKLQAGGKLSDYTVHAHVAGGQNVAFKVKHVKAEPTRIGLILKLPHAYQFAEVAVTVYGKDDDNKEITVPFEPVTFVVDNFDADGNAHVDRDAKNRSSFLAAGERATTRTPKFWPNSEADGTKCVLTGDLNGSIKLVTLNPVPQGSTVPGLRAAPLNDSLHLVVAITNQPATPVKDETASMQIRH